MDYRHYFQDLLLVIFLVNFHPGFTLSIEDDYEDGPSFGRCPWIRNKLKNGRVRYRYKGRVAKFLCDSGYDLAGKRSSTCVRGQWSNPVPVCVARGCLRVPSIANGHVTEMYRGALLVYDCNPGYSLEGSPSIHCDGRRWSTSAPHCVVATENPEVSCDFESPDLCGWSHDPNHDFDWKRNQFSTPSGHAGTGPSFDHTFGENKGGYYLYIEASSPRKINDTARLFSPVYSADLSGGCFLFWYHMYGATTGGLRIYIKPESHVFDELLPNWELFGNQGNTWNRGKISIPALHENFQIVIEGIRGESYVGDSAIDDVFLTAQDCGSIGNDTGIVEHTNSDSCRGRCREAVSGSSCSCRDNCFTSHNCCSDYNTFCFEGNDTIAHNADEILPEDNPISKTSTSTLTGGVTTLSDTDIQSLSMSPTEKSSTQLPDIFSSSTALETVRLVDSSVSSYSTSVSSVISNTTSNDFSSVTNITLLQVHTTTGESMQITNKATTPFITSTAKSFTSSISSPRATISTSTSVVPTSSSTSSVVTTASFTTSAATSTISTASVAPTTSSSTLAKTSIISTTAKSTSSSIPIRTTVTSSRKVTETTISSINPPKLSTILTSKNTTPSTTVEVPSFTNTTVTSIATKMSTTNNTLPSTTGVVKFTTTPSTSMPASSSVTTMSSTRKTYNLRPRTQRATTPVSSSTYAYNTTVTANKIKTNTTLLPKSYTVSHSSKMTTQFKNDISTFSEAKSSITDSTISKRTSVTTSSSIPSTTLRVPIYVQPSRPSTTKVPTITSTRLQHMQKTTTHYTPKIFRFSFTQTPSPPPTTSEMGASRAVTTASNGSTPIVISLIVVIICIAGGVAYYIRKRRNKRQSKLSDDSEMRFLQENDYMDYSDASALDRILVK